MRIFRKMSYVAACAVLMGAGGVAFLPQHAVAADMNMNMSDKNIIQTATGPNMEQVTTLVTAVKAAGLVDTLEGKGPFTVFAPTNAAFGKLPKGTVDDLLKPENKEKLVKILTFHVVSGNDNAMKLMHTKKLKTVEGGELKIETKDGKVMVGNDKGMATVTKANIVCSNGTIHWIDTVLMPD